MKRTVALVVGLAGVAGLTGLCGCAAEPAAKNGRGPRIDVPFDAVWHVRHEPPEVRRIRDRDLKELQGILTDPASFDEGTNDCYLSLYSLVFFKDGQVVMTLTPNLTGMDLGAAPRADGYPQAWSRAGMERILHFIQHQIVHRPPQPAEFVPPPVAKLLAEWAAEKRWYPTRPETPSKPVPAVADLEDLSWRVGKMLRTKVRMNFDGQELGFVLDYLHECTEESIKLIGDDTPPQTQVTITAGTVTVAEALDLILKARNLRITAAGNTVFIGSEQSLDDFVESRKQPDAPLPATRAADQPFGAQVALARLRAINRVESSHVGAGAVPSEVYALYERMRKGASRSDLLPLLDDKCPAVRVYALWALKANFPDTDLLPLLIKHLGDTETVGTLFACEGGSESVADLMAEHVYPDLKPAAKMQLLDWLLSHPNKLQVRQSALAERPLPAGFHARIRALAQSGGAGALEALASYKDPADVPILLDRLKAQADGPFPSYEAFRAVAEFPHPAFMPRLEQLVALSINILAKGDNRSVENVFQAVAAYNTPQAAALLHSPLKLPAQQAGRETAIAYAFQAAALHPAPCYIPLLFESFEATHLPRMRDPVPAGSPPAEKALLDMLYQADPARTIRTIRYRFSQADLYLHDRSAVIAMRDILFAHLKPAEAWSIFDLALPHADSYLIQDLAAFAVEQRSASTLPILIRMVAATDTPDIRWHVRDALKKLGRQGLDDAIGPLVKSGAIPAAQWQTARQYIWTPDPE